MRTRPHPAVLIALTALTWYGLTLLAVGATPPATAATCITEPCGPPAGEGPCEYDTPCTDPEPVTPPAPEFGGDCDTGYVTIPDVAEVAYELDGQPVGPGDHPLAVGEHTVTAHPVPPFELADGATVSWSYTVEACPDPTTTSTAAPTSTTASPSTSVTQPPVSQEPPTVSTVRVTAPPGGTDVPFKPTGNLPATGSNTAGLVTVGLLLVAGGGGLVVVTRRLRRI